MDADGKPTRQVAEVDFERDEWKKQGLTVRVIAVRSKERDTGKQLYLWDDSEWTAQAFLTNDLDGDADELAREYDGRAGIEPLIAELKGAFGIGKVPSADFEANHAALLIKLLSHNLLRRYVFAMAPEIAACARPGFVGRSSWCPAALGDTAALRICGWRRDLISSTEKARATGGDGVGGRGPCIRHS